MKNLLLLLSVVLLLLAIIINNGILIALKSESDRASLGIIILLGSIVFIIIGVRKYGELWSKRKKVIVPTIAAISIVIIYLFASTISIYSRYKSSSNVPINPEVFNDNELIHARIEFISGLNKTLSTISEKSNGFYSIVASSEGDNITFSYKIKIENEISTADSPINALVNETVKTYKENGTIKTLRILKYNTLTMTFSSTTKENSRKIDLNNL